MDETAPLRETLNADTVPLAPPAWALETYRWAGFVGENSLPNGPADWAANGDPVAGISRPLGLTVKLSISQVLESPVPTSTPIRLVPVELKRMSPGLAVLGSEKVDPGIAMSLPSGLSLKPV